MKGVVFTEFVDYMTDRYGLAVTNDVIDSSHLASQGAYTAVGDYEVEEFERMLSRLSEQTIMPPSMLLREYGYRLFFQLADIYPQYAAGHDPFDLLASADEYLNIEVRKLYPDAVLPELTHRMLSSTQMLLVYKSQHGLGDLIEGLIQGCFDFYREEAIISREDQSGGMGTHLRFTIRKLGPVES